MQKSCISLVLRSCTYLHSTLGFVHTSRPSLLLGTGISSLTCNILGHRIQPDTNRRIHEATTTGGKDTRGSMSRPKVCVVGAGVMGLGSAIQILEKFPNVDLTIVAEKFSPNTTSDGSAGFWEPYLVGDTSPELINKWSKSTYDHLNSIIVSEDAEEAGVEAVSGYNFFPRNYDPSWKHVPIGFRHATRRELDLYAPHAKFGIFYTSIMCGCVRYLPWLEKRIRQRGGTLIKRKVEDFAELAGHYDIIVNCSGLGSYHLADDKSMAPIQGQVMRVKNTTARLFMLDFEEDCQSAHTYVFPWRDIAVLGGTAVKGAWDEVPSVKTRNEIIERCCKFVPSLKNTTILEEWTGLRPWRSKGVRLEREVMRFGPTKVHVVHNYGHSGGGVTLHWGCAEDATELVGQCLRELYHHKL